MEDPLRSSRLILVLSLLVVHLLPAQTKLDLPPNYCSFAGQKEAAYLTVAEPDEALRQAVAGILGHIGTPMPFTLKSGDAENAVAMTVNGVPYIVYNSELMSKLEILTGSKKAVISVLAHEIGHYLYHHDFNAKTGDRVQQELQADYWSGYTMYGIGVNPEEAVKAVELMTNEFPPPTHPARSQREAKIKSGWWDAYLTEHHPPDYALAVSPNAVPQQAFTGPDTTGLNQAAISKYIGRAVFFADATPYFLTARSDIVSVNALGQPTIVGGQQETRKAGYAWTLSTPTGRFEVDPGGKIWTLDGMKTQVGYIAQIR